MDLMQDPMQTWWISGKQLYIYICCVFMLYVSVGVTEFCISLEQRPPLPSQKRKCICLRSRGRGTVRNLTTLHNVPICTHTHMFTHTCTFTQAHSQCTQAHTCSCFHIILLRGSRREMSPPPITVGTDCPPATGFPRPLQGVSGFWHLLVYLRAQY